MTFGGWVVMLISIGTVTSLLAWCLYKVFKTASEAQPLQGGEVKALDGASAHESVDSHREGED